MKNMAFLSILTICSLSSLQSTADETYFFWYGSVPDSVSWAPFDWDAQDRSSGFATSVDIGEFYNHTPNAGDDVQLNRSLTFSVDSMAYIGAHHPTVLPGGVGSVSLWIYYDYSFGFSWDGSMNTIYLSVKPGYELIEDNFLGVQMVFNQDNFQIVSSDNPSGVEGPSIKKDDWNHFVFTDDGQTTKLSINDEDAGLQLSTGGNLCYFNLADGKLNDDGSLTDGESLETWFIDDIECTSTIESGYKIIEAPLTSNQVTIDGKIEPEEIAGANSITWDGSTTERPGVHAQFYGQWQLPTPEDLTATLYIQNNGEMLFISIDVVDDIINVAESASWWEEDSTEIYIDYDNSRNTSGATQISVRADNGLSNTDDFAAWLEIRSKLKSDQSGWQIEAAVNMAEIGLSQDETYGFDVSINDSDGENEPGYQGAQEWLYASYEFAYSNESYWGNMQILSASTKVDNWSVFE